MSHKESEKYLFHLVLNSCSRPGFSPSPGLACCSVSGIGNLSVARVKVKVAVGFSLGLAFSQR